VHRGCVLVLVTAAACGRVGFGDVAAPGVDGAIAGGDVGAVQYATPTIVQSAIGFELAPSVTVTIVATAASDTIAVAIAGYFGVMSVSDDVGNAYARAVMQGDPNSDTAEIWYAKPGQGGATAITVDMPNANNTVVWVLELANIDPDAPIAGTMGSSASSSGTLATAAEVTTTIGGAIVLDVGAGGASFDSLRAGAFTALAQQYGDAAAFDISAQPGSYGATWNVSDGEAWAIAAAAFAPAPR
jgi:hypothetical protein